MAAASDFRLPIGGGLQNTLPQKKILAATANWKAEATGGGNQNILQAKKPLGSGRQWHQPPKKVGLSAKFYFAAGRHYQLCPAVTKIRELVIAQFFFYYTFVEPTIIYEDQQKDYIGIKAPKYEKLILKKLYSFYIFLTHFNS